MLTVGHSTRTIEEFLSLLKAHGATCVVDVRSLPRSRRNPQFNRDTLPASLTTAHISYIHLEGLGGLRRARPDSINTAWINASFRGYADYMQTPEFEASLERLIEIATKERVALMCAEARVPNVAMPSARKLAYESSVLASYQLPTLIQKAIVRFSQILFSFHSHDQDVWSRSSYRSEFPASLTAL